eukprot:TRINITY_DN5103_c0_g1_i2.p1 TRINITY_DN5103_c0_g1~~TRINITY_DN5103_c0_g1_i2.p1  ORF type:complete len:178 (+),score=14.90 TRINITY_DN5103_c0_g1_i2:119-652(+)
MCIRDRYNCKRKIVNLGPISFEEFDEKKAQVLNSSASDISDSANYRCDSCNKFFSSNSQYVQHLRSKKHKIAEKAERQRKEVGIKEMIEKHGKVYSTLDSLDVCLFCNKKKQKFRAQLCSYGRISLFCLAILRSNQRQEGCNAISGGKNSHREYLYRMQQLSNWRIQKFTGSTTAYD